MSTRQEEREAAKCSGARVVHALATGKQSPTFISSSTTSALPVPNAQITLVSPGSCHHSVEQVIKTIASKSVDYGICQV